MGQPVGVKRTGPLAATRRALDAIGKRETPAGEVALVLAGRLEDPDCPATAMAAMSKELRATLTELGRDAPAVNDPVDELRKRRAARRSA